MSPLVPWNEYPRPQMQRESFLCLNGVWDFAATAGKAPDKYPGKVTVPYPVESSLSGIEKHYPKGTVLWYRRSFSLPEGFNIGRVLLNFGAVDQIAEIFLNGKKLGEFCTAVEGTVSRDVTDVLVPGENELVFRVTDDLDERIPYGKQRERRGGMWYTPFSGIWQTVWMESVPEKHIRSLQITPFADRAEIRVIGDGVAEGCIEWEGHTEHYCDGFAVIRPEEVKNWSPEMPYLYYFSVKSGEDEVYSYFALRTITIGNVDGTPRICLNGKPYFFHGLLDQGYFHDGICTPKEESGYKRDILAAKRMGFNTLRKHIKVEPEVFYYECDRLGMIVLQDMVNNGKYRFVRDTLLPNLGLLKKNDTAKSIDPVAKENYRKAVGSTVERLYNHPCICGWTLFNEGWGQFDSSTAYDMLKAMDQTRFIDSASGWFAGEKTDVCSIHTYFKKFRLPKKSEQPVILSEFGGYALKIEGHTCSRKEPYGYRLYKNAGKYMTALEKLYLTEIIPAAEKGLCGAVYTQISDVEEELNGMLTYDRQRVKPDEERMRSIAAKLSTFGVEKTGESDNV